eukprot:CAMPEP_0184384116 /NCGR_PEP_ID=MMETSP0007-20130409/7661_1 /TAXON_ID=97485 /ORGANISM="Prymnesium parvum, Strain Texoma1" /LENGTH=78 /DNA_ID=CAMNT_0026730863 /DNA_START=450 /DNA_END=686 /DNA_ORIENTATION=-
MTPTTCCNSRRSRVARGSCQVEALSQVEVSRCKLKLAGLGWSEALQMEKEFGPGRERASNQQIGLEHLVKDAVPAGGV